MKPKKDKATMWGKVLKKWPAETDPKKIRKILEKAFKKGLRNTVRV